MRRLLLVFLASCGGAIEPDAPSCIADAGVTVDAPLLVSACDADARDYRAVCVAHGAPSGFAYLGACLREIPPQGYPRNDILGPDSGGGVPFDSSGLHRQFIGGCRGVGGYHDPDWRNDVICCP